MCIAWLAVSGIVGRRLPPWVDDYIGIPVTFVLLTLCVVSLRHIARARKKLLRQDRAFWGFCAACGYSLTGNLSGVCPECGKKVI
jgi:hypothetical protein